MPGHWEGDLITGKNNASAIGTLVERVTGFTLLLHLPDGHGAQQVTAAITEAMTALPANLRKTLTWDQGKELFSRHKQIAEVTGLHVYFCDPHSPWQRATNENTNGLLRQYFPKGTDLSVHTKEDLAWVLVAQQEAIAQGCDQVVFLDAQELTYVEELGGMNMYFVYADGRIVTPETGTILEGITRASVMELAGKLGHPVEERRISIDEWRDGVTSGDIVEIFACGTAAVVTPVGSLRGAYGETPAPASTELTMKIRQSLVDVQCGRAEDTFGWMHRVC